MKKEEVKDVKVVEEKKDEKTKKTLKLAWDIFFWTCFACILIMWIVDFVNTKKEKEPIFCIAKETIEKNNGTIDSCPGLGYKVYTYHTEGKEGAREFGAFWISPRD